MKNVLIFCLVVALVSGCATTLPQRTIPVEKDVKEIPTRPPKPEPPPTIPEPAKPTELPTPPEPEPPAALLMVEPEPEPKAVKPPIPSESAVEKKRPEATEKVQTKADTPKPKKAPESDVSADSSGYWQKTKKVASWIATNILLPLILRRVPLPRIPIPK